MYCMQGVIRFTFSLVCGYVMKTNNDLPYTYSSIYEEIA